jgi:hypothetical protein
MSKLSTVLTGLSIGAAAAVMVLIALASDLSAYRPTVVGSTHAGSLDAAAAPPPRSARERPLSPIL